jgi:peptide/nickel transport system permease protein
MTVAATKPSNVLSRYEIIREFKRSKSGLAGVAIILILVGMSIYSATAIPLESFRQWNSPNYWIDLPRGAAPSWVNIGFGPKIPEHTVLYMNDATITGLEQGSLRTVVYSYDLNFSFDNFPSDFMFLYSAKYGNTPPVLQVDIVRPDGREFMVYFASLPSSQEEVNEFSARVFSTDRSIAENLREYENAFSYDQNPSRPQMMIFADVHENQVLKGKYVIRETFYLFNPQDSVQNSGVILGGKVYGLVGTDELRRDLAVGILWGAPMALFIGFTVLA